MNGVTFAHTERSQFWLDPRTKFVILLAVNFVLMGGGLSGASTVIRPVFACMPFLLLLVERKFRSAILYFIFLSAALGMEIFLVTHTQGAVNLLIIIASGLLSRFVPVLVMGYYVVSTTKISELVAAMERMHLPRQIIIPFSVMLRFFPTVKEEMGAINDAMRMRGIRPGGQNPGAMLEYRIVPMLICSVKIGEELSASALTRGLGNPVRRTNICRVGFAARDWLLIGLTVGLLGLWIVF